MHDIIDDIAEWDWANQAYLGGEGQSGCPARPACGWVGS
ncbi:MAG: hypothetical protein JWM19_3638 [Actinomycetia bacterium]|nr:hypothetical protein [Actinomycetes bacterium]